MFFFFFIKTAILKLCQKYCRDTLPAFSISDNAPEISDWIPTVKQNGGGGETIWNGFSSLKLLPIPRLTESWKSRKPSKCADTQKAVLCLKNGCPLEVTEKWRTKWLHSCPNLSHLNDQGLHVTIASASSKSRAHMAPLTWIQFQTQVPKPNFLFFRLDQGCQIYGSSPWCYQWVSELLHRQYARCARWPRALHTAPAPEHLLERQRGSHSTACTDHSSAVLHNLGEARAGPHHM